MSFKFLQPETIPEAVSLLAEYGDEARIIAGGTAVVLMLQQKLIAPGVLVSVSRLPDLNYVQFEPDGLHIGALTLLREVEQSPLVQARYPALAHACGEVGNVRVRNQATLGGNLAEADYASDPPSMLLALDAAVTITGPSGVRTAPLAKFFLGFYTTILEPEEIITEIVVPPLADAARTTYLSYKSRSSEDRPCVTVAAVAEFEGDICRDLRIAVGAASEIPQRFNDIEATALDQSLTDGLIQEIAAGYADNIEPLEDLRGSAWYRTEMVRVHVRRALEEVRHGHR